MFLHRLVIVAGSFLFLPLAALAGEELQAPTADGLPGLLSHPSAEPFEGGTIGLSLSGTGFDQLNFDGAGNRAVGGSGTVGIGYTLSRRLAVSAWLSAVGLNSPTGLPQPLQSGHSGVQFVLLPYAARKPRTFLRGVGLRGGVRATSGTVLVDGWEPTASPFADLIVSMGAGPFRLDLSGGYLHDRSDGLVRSGIVPTPEESSTLDPLQRHLYGVGMAPQIRWGAGTQLVLARGHLRPFVEYRGVHTDGITRDSHAVAMGMRLALPAFGRMVSFTAGADYAIAGTGPRLPRPAEPDWRGFFSLGLTAPRYRVDTVIREIDVNREWERVTPAAALAEPAVRAAPVESVERYGTLSGLVRDAESGEPLASAVVSFTNMDRNALLTDTRGKFRVRELEPTERIRVRVTAPGYEPVVRAGRVKAGQTGNVVFELSSSAEALGVLRGTIRDRTGEPVLARLRVSGDDDGSEPQQLQADDAGRFEIELAPGTYQLDVEADSFTQKNKAVIVEAGQLMILNLVMTETAMVEPVMAQQ